ncbi:hypothetical protein B0O80DRAFT_501243 [Mortierella sp. GBAus27b]|nr:hypothetical protein B0O80DRAFT_501243 [Mortierella sp. GBAus27b]
MGLTGWWQFLKAAGLEPPPFNLKELGDCRLEVDVMSTFYSLIILKVLDAKRKGKSAFHAGVQDQLAHAELKKLESVVDRVEERAQSGKKTSKATWMEIERRIRRTFRLTEEDKAMFQRGLETRFSVCRCTSETDLCIARLPPRDGRRIAITADSDLLAFENVTEILRPLPHSKGYGLYSREEVLEAFGFSSSSQLVALACVSANDYGKNIPGFGIKTNIGIIKGLASAQSVPEVIERYLHEVCTRTGKSVTMEEFTTRTMIYHHNTDSVIQESLLLSGVPGNMIDDTEMSFIADAEEPTLTALDHTIDEDVPNDMNTSLVSMPVSIRQTLDPHLGGLLDRLNRSKETLRNLVAKSRTTRSDRPFYVANGSTMNQYRPVFSSESAILSGKRYSDITQAKPKHCDPPKIRAKNDNSPITKEKKKKKKKKKQEGKRKQGGGTGPPRKLNPSTVFDHELRKTHPVKSLTIGSAAANMKRKGLTENEAKAMQDQLKVGTDLANQLQLRAYYACAITITHLLDEESLAPLLSSTTPGTDISETRRTIFNHMLDSQTFMFALGRLLFLGEPRSKKESNWKLGDPRCPLPSESAQMVYNLFQENTGLLPLKTNPEMSQIAIGKLSEMSMIPVQAAIRSHYRNCDFEIEKNKEMNDIEFFFLHNGTSKTYADFPKAALRPGFVNFSETVLIDIFWANKDTKAILQARLREDDVGDTKQSVQQFVQDHKARLVDKLFGHNGYNNASLQEQTDKPTKLKLKGTVCTNGLVLHVLAYDTSVLRPKAAREKASREDEDDMDSNDFDGMDVDDPFIDPDDFEIEDDDTDVKPGDNHPQSASTAQDTYKGLTINWKQGSSLLTNVEVQFDHPDKCPSPDDTIVIGIDPGVVNAVTAAVIDPHRPNSRQVVKIKKSFLYSPYVKFRSALETQKRELGITQLEHDIPAFSRENLKDYLTYMTKPSGIFPTVLARIMDFYKGSWYLKKSWDCRKATAACLDLAIKGILRMAEINEGQKKNQKRRQVVFCIGLGSFDARKGLPSKHTGLLKRLITRVKSIGYVVVGAHEFFTSAKCPRPGCTAFVFGKGNRSKHCPSCHQFFDRDAIGSENLARVCQGQLQNQKRPDKYKPERPDPSVQEQGPSTPERKKRHTDLDIPPARRSPRLAKVLEV